MPTTEELEAKAHRANELRHGLAGAGTGAVASGLTAAALRAAGVKIDPTTAVMAGTGLGGFAGMARSRAENLKDTLGQRRQDDRHLRRLVLRESLKKHSSAAFADELHRILAGG